VKERKDSLIELCRSLPGATEDVKWGSNLIFSVGGKMFAGFDLPDGEPLAFKVDPALFDEIASSKGFVPAPYMAKASWVSVPERKKVPVATLKKLIVEAHRLIGEKLSKRRREALGLLR
jgi:predicted DNA-binding protein (MmcQ/YjbR family)